MARREHIPRTTFTEHALRHEATIPGFFQEGPAHYDSHLFNGKNSLNTVDALILAIKTSQGLRVSTAIRSHNEERQPDVASVPTVRQTHAETRDVLDGYEQDRIPILGGNQADIGREGYHVTDIIPTDPTLVADYTPKKYHSLNETLLRPTFSRLVDKLRPDIDDGQSISEILLDNSTYWRGPAVVGVSEVGEDRFEANSMGSIIAVLDLSDKSPEEILQFFPQANQHYDYFDLAPLESFDLGVKNNSIDQVIPSIEEHNRKEYALACVKGLCVRVAVAGLRRHIGHIGAKLGIDIPYFATDTKRLYQLPIPVDSDVIR